jgi:ABC-2 type transport system permease protein
MLSLFLIESKRQWTIFKRYPIEAFAGVLVFTIIFIGLFAGSKYLAGAQSNFGSRLDEVVAGYVLWLVTTGLFAGPGSQLTEDARSGILEQLFVAPHNFTAFSVLRIFSGLLQHLLLIVIVLTVICLITGSRLDYHPLELVPFAGVVLAASGLGLAVAAYAMTVKQVGAILGIGQFLLMAFVVTPIASFGRWGAWLSSIVPINPASQLLQNELATGHGASALQILVALGNGVAYFLLGAFLLELSSQRARRLANIGGF